MSETFGQHIRSLREEKGLTQRALSQAVGFRSLAHLSDIESGKRNPAKETLSKFAKALGVALSDLESRDTRGPIEAAKTLFARKPEMVGAFLKVIEAARKMDAEELVARVTQREKAPKEEAPIIEKASAQPVAPVVPPPAAVISAPSPQPSATEPLKVSAPQEPAFPATGATVPTPEVPKVIPAPKPVVEKKPSNQPTLF
ncbi:MAG: helix-turn-helix domain-containing protein [Terrimicrobiaceae bacterium]